MTLERNPHYYGSAPKLDRIVFKVVPDLNAQVAQLRAGELDLVTLEPANLASVQGVPGVEVLQVPVVQHVYVGLNVRRPHFRAAEVRRALGLAINRAAIIDGVLRGYADLPRGTIPVVLKDYFADSLPPIPYAPDSALALLARAGWKRGPDGQLRDAAGAPFTFELLLDKGNPTREQSALAVQQDLQRIGVTVTLRTMEFAALVRDRVLPGNFDATLDLVDHAAGSRPVRLLPHRAGQQQRRLVQRRRRLAPLARASDARRPAGGRRSTAPSSASRWRTRR